MHHCIMANTQTRQTFSTNDVETGNKLIEGYIRRSTDAATFDKMKDIIKIINNMAHECVNAWIFLGDLKREERFGTGWIKATNTNEYGLDLVIWDEKLYMAAISIDKSGSYLFDWVFKVYDAGMLKYELVMKSHCDGLWYPLGDVKDYECLEKTLCKCKDHSLAFEIILSLEVRHWDEYDFKEFDITLLPEYDKF